MDDILVENLVRFLIMSLTCVFDIAIISASNPILVVATLPVVYFIISRVKYYLQASREVERLMATSGSPLYEHFVQTIEGAAIIRAFNKKETQKNKIYRLRRHERKTSAHARSLYANEPNTSSCYCKHMQISLSYFTKFQ
jgi:ABC-type multidrug transport system fused ATPase/permease subunit